MINIYFDGCCEPINPGGTAGYGFVIFSDNKEIHRSSKLLRPTPGKRDTSNNVAEYQAMITALEYLEIKGLQNANITFYGDSKLVIEQMFGTWNINKGLYVKYALEAKEILRKFPKAKGQWIPREENGIADELSKGELIRAGIEFRIQPLK